MKNTLFLLIFFSNISIFAMYDKADSHQVAPIFKSQELNDLFADSIDIGQKVEAILIELKNGNLDKEQRREQIMKAEALSNARAQILSDLSVQYIVGLQQID